MAIIFAINIRYLIDNQLSTFSACSKGSSCGTFLLAHGNAPRASRAAGPEPGEARGNVAAAPRCRAAAVPQEDRFPVWNISSARDVPKTGTSGAFSAHFVRDVPKTGTSGAPSQQVPPCKHTS